MSDTISEPIRDLPRSTMTAAALAAAQAKQLQTIKGAAEALDAEVAALEANKDLSGPAASRRIAEARQRFTADQTDRWTQLRNDGQLAKQLLEAFHSPQAVRGRLMASDLGAAAAALSTTAALDAPALYSMAVEAGRVSDPLLASVLLVEIRKRHAAGVLGDGDAKAIASLAEAVPLPAAELADREKLQDAVIAGDEADAVYRAAASGQPESAIAKLQRERTRQAVTGDTARREPPMAPDRLRAELERQRAS